MTYMQLTRIQILFAAFFLLSVYLYTAKAKLVFAVGMALTLLHTYDHLFMVQRKDKEEFILGGI